MKRVILLRSNPVMPDPPVEKMADALLEMGYAVTIVAWDRNSDTDTQTVKSEHCHVVRFGATAAYGAGAKSLGALVRFQWKLWNWLRQNRGTYDIIHAFDLDTGLVARMAAGMWRKKFVYHILDFYADSHFSRDWVRGAVARLERGVIERADSVIICTEKRREQLGRCRQKHIDVIHNTPPESLAGTGDVALQGPGQRSRIAYVGTMLEGRGIIQMLDAVREDSRFELHMGGFGPLADQVEQAAQEEQSGVFWYGRLPYEQTLALERQCDIMLALYDPAIPNHRYAAPNKLYEAMMLGKPVLTCAGIGWDDVVKEQETGMLTEFSPEGMRKGLDEIFALRDRWAAMGENARTCYRDRYSWQKMKQRIGDIYSRLG